MERSGELRTLAPLTALAAILLAGCGTLENGRRWGDDAVILPGLDRLGCSALRAAISPGTWLPAAGAIVTYAVDDFDMKISRWAEKKSPIFGSQQSAVHASDPLLWGLAGSAVVTALLTPSGSGTTAWAGSKAKGMAVEGAGVLATVLTIHGLKTAIRRKRPIDLEADYPTGDNSFPSGHSGAGFSLATLTSRNLDSISMPGGARTTLQAGAYATAGLLAWSRVESLHHYASDVLAGAAIGHFLTAFIHDAFLGLEETDPGVFEVSMEDQSAVLSAVIRF